MKWLAYDATTGEIKVVGEAPADSTFAHIPYTLTVVQDIADGILPLTHYVQSGAPVLFPPQPSAYHEWDWATKTWVGLVAKAKAARVRQLAAEYQRRKNLQLVYDTKTLDTDAEARDQLVFKAFEFAERVRLNQPAEVGSRVWENADGTFHIFGADGVFRNWLGGFVIALSDRNASLRLTARKHRIAIKDLTTVEAVEAYDITTGWV